MTLGHIPGVIFFISLSFSCCSIYLKRMGCDLCANILLSENVCFGDVMIYIDIYIYIFVILVRNVSTLLPELLTFQTLRTCLDWGEREGEYDRIELAKNRLIFGQLYSTLLYSIFLPSIQTDHKVWGDSTWTKEFGGWRRNDWQK